MLKYVSKFAMDILPSVVATIIGAYIVNHYIVTKPGRADAAAAVSSSFAPKKADRRQHPRTGREGEGYLRKVHHRQIGRRKGRKLGSGKAGGESPPTSRRRPRASLRTRAVVPPARAREKAVAKTIPAQPVTPVVEPVVAAPNTAPPVEAAIAPDRDANDLARAAIERLRGTPKRAARAGNRAPAGSAPRGGHAGCAIGDRAAGSAAAAADHGLDACRRDIRCPDANRPTRPRRGPTIRAARRRRPIFPTRGRSICVPRRYPPKPRTNVAEDVLSAAKSMFHAVLPNKEADQDSDGSNRF